MSRDFSLFQKPTQYYFCLYLTCSWFCYLPVKAVHHEYLSKKCRTVEQIVMLLHNVFCTPKLTLLCGLRLQCVYKRFQPYVPYPRPPPPPPPPPPPLGRRISPEKALFLLFFFSAKFRLEYSHVPVCQSYVLVCYSYVPVCTGMFFVCYSYVTRMLPICTRMLLVCSRMYSYVTRMWSYVLVCLSYATRVVY